MKNQMVKVYVLLEDLPKIKDGKIPSEYWFSKPDGYNDVMEMSISISVLKQWEDGNEYIQTQLLFD